MSNVCESKHPLVAHKLSRLRDKKTEPRKFRELVREIAALLAYEATADLATKHSDGFSCRYLILPLPLCPPLLPSYVSFITGISFEQLTSEKDRKRVRFLTITNSLAFVAGFSAVFISLGASSSFFGQILYKYQEWIRIGGGVLVIIFGLFISGLAKFDFLLREKRVHLHGQPAGYLGSFLVGMTFAAAWSPCIGPIGNHTPFCSIRRVNFLWP